MLMKLTGLFIDIYHDFDDDALDAEQAHFNTLDDDMSGLALRLEALIAPTRPDVPDTPALDCRPLNRKLARVQAGLNRINEATADTEEPIDCTLLS